MGNMLAMTEKFSQLMRFEFTPGYIVIGLQNIENEENIRMESRGWWYAPVIFTLGRGRQENQEFQVTLGYTGSSRPA